MATHSSVLAWRIPGMGEPGELPSMGLHRVGHNWSDLAAAAAAGCTNGQGKARIKAWVFGEVVAIWLHKSEWSSDDGKWWKKYTGFKPCWQYLLRQKKKKADGKWGAAIPHCTDQSCSLGASDRRGQGLLLCPSPFCASLLKDRACLKYEDLPRLKRRFCEAVVWGTVIWKHVLHPGKSRGREFDEFGLERVKLIYLFFLVVLGELISFLKINVWILL